jgi:hypothetical protein
MVHWPDKISFVAGSRQLVDLLNTGLLFLQSLIEALQLRGRSQEGGNCIN